MSNYVQRRDTPKRTDARILTREEEAALIRSWKNGDKEAGAEFVQAFQPLIRGQTYTWGRHYTHVDKEDVSAAVHLGFAVALEKFKPDKGVRFSTYAIPWIKALVQQEAHGNAKVRAASKTQEARAVFAAVSRAQNTQEGVSLHEIYQDVAQARGVDVARIRKIHESAIYIVSGDGGGKRKDGEENSSIIDSIADPAPQAADVIADRNMASLLRDAVETLPARQKYIIAARFGLMSECAGEPRTLEQVGNALGITKERARQLEVAGLQRLRRHFQAHGFELGSDLIFPRGKMGYAPPVHLKPVQPEIAEPAPVPAV